MRHVVPCVTLPPSILQHPACTQALDYQLLHSTSRKPHIEAPTNNLHFDQPLYVVNNRLQFAVLCAELQCMQACSHEVCALVPNVSYPGDQSCSAGRLVWESPHRSAMTSYTCTAIFRELGMGNLAHGLSTPNMPCAREASQWTLLTVTCLPSKRTGKKWICPSGFVCVSCKKGATQCQRTAW